MGEGEKDVLSQIEGIVEGREKSEQARLKELLETLAMRGLAARVFLEREVYEEELSPEEARRVGVQPGKPMKVLEPVDIFILPLEEDQGSHLVIDIRRGLEIYRTEPSDKDNPSFTDRYKECFREAFLGNSSVFLGEGDLGRGTEGVKNLPFGHASLGLFVAGKKVFLTAERFSYLNKAELNGVVEKAVRVGMEIRKKEKEFRRRATRTLIDKLSSLIENGRTGSGADHTPLQE